MMNLQNDIDKIITQLTTLKPPNKSNPKNRIIINCINDIKTTLSEAKEQCEELQYLLDCNNHDWNQHENTIRNDRIKHEQMLKYIMPYVLLYNLCV